MLIALLTGLVTGLTLIVAIGAQNAFVLRQGLLREHVLEVVVICALSDLTLILAGVGGVGVLIERAPAAVETVRWAGVAFLVWYGVSTLLRARRPGTLDAARGNGSSRRGAAIKALALTWLNPHVYLDTVLFLGSIGNSQGGDRWSFAVGACTASIVWFTVLGFGAHRAAGLLATPRAWRILDVAIGTVMMLIALRLALN
ncbi:L-lysine exporter [Nocardioides salsibiostraticola]